MKNLLFASILLALSAPVLATDVGVSLNIGQPGFYGRIDIGDYPPPQLIYRQPMMVERVMIERPPVYLRVPPGHAKNWRKHCHQYNACGERVYFVQNNWYEREYVPRYQERHGNRHDDHRETRQDDHREARHDDHREARQDDHREARHDEHGDGQRGYNGNEHKGKGHDKKNKH